jgi:hypothetical protein
MVIDDFNVPSAVILPVKADSPLIIDSDAVPPAPATTQFLQSRLHGSVQGHAKQCFLREARAWLRVLLLLVSPQTMTVEPERGMKRLRTGPHAAVV